MGAISLPSDHAIRGGVRTREPHDSGAKHTSGEAVYIDDIAEPPGLLAVHIAMSESAHAGVRINVDKVASAPGIALVLTASDIPGVNDVSPLAKGDDPIFADGLVEYRGQSLFAVAANSIGEARAAASHAVVEYDERPAILTIDQAMEAQSLLEPAYVMARGDADAAIEAALHVLSGRIRIGGQEHFYLEGQAALAVPGEDEDIIVHSSTQHPSEIQKCIAHVLGIASHAVTVECRRMGGGFGGKESQGNLPAAVAALVAAKTGRPAKVRYDRDDDMAITGKRHSARIDYQVGFDDEGRIAGIAFEQAMDCGMSWDLSLGICDRAMFHADNAYYLPAAKITSYRCKTNTASNTAFRGFGGPQGMVGIERVIDEIAHHLGLDPLDVRQANFYGHKDAGPERKTTHYHMEVEDCVIQDIAGELEASSDYRQRRAEIRDFNRQSPVLKRGIALTPVKFGISFTVTHLNQAGALVNLYADGSVSLNHGGTEMGQGLFIKVAQVVAEELQIDRARVKITATNTSKVPNTSPTAASSGSDINGMAARDAARTIKARLAEFAAGRHQVSTDEVVFLPGRVQVGGEEVSFDQLVHDAYMARVPLSATGFYATPKIS
ncbi:MAG: xanthine dehydrogenase molybdopterin binding subunit, partial [Rhizobiales bacterium]|nr:xanthine dehydrogenase molybdopterin binding subunit [Hyphomicrobiales bacterium]